MKIGDKVKFKKCSDILKMIEQDTTLRYGISDPTIRYYGSSNKIYTVRETFNRPFKSILIEGEPYYFPMQWFKIPLIN